MQPIVFYDIPCKTAGATWSPNIWRIRYALNYKQLPYTTVWIEYPDIAALYTETLKIPPCSTRRDGSPYYCLPVIHDPNTDTTISDSPIIAAYLDKTYPDPERALFPPNTHTLQKAFRSAYDEITGPMAPFVIPRIADILRAPSEVYFVETRSKSFGKPLREVFPTGEEYTEKWEKTKNAFGKIDAWYCAEESGGPFVMGKKPTFADFVIGGEMQWTRVAFGEDSKEWKEWASWHGGRWAKLIEDLKPYEGEDQV
ncbi:GST N-terminal domain-containing protein [Mycena chlorophos]|uniref:GST N-terminal domain-containing protein n=1 Tax=Mycena chlorophos TaxID=658473 RepID=A0A8H6S2T0_MYCCL|nr:GST N-terminal domain-containing protein [Mycena chlorophos]